jgi:hypothetical protein
MSSYTYYTVGTENRYGLDGPGIESRWARDFPHLSKPALWPTQPPRQEVKRPGLGVNHTSLSSAEVKQKSRPISPFLFWAFMTCCRANFTFLPYVFTGNTEDGLFFLFSFHYELRINILGELFI